MEEKSIDHEELQASNLENHAEIEKIKTHHSNVNTPVNENLQLHLTASQRAERGLGASEVDFNPDWRFVVAFLSLTAVTIMVALDATSLSVALPIMAEELNGSAIQAFWAGTSFLLTSTVFQPVLGSFSNIFGRKPIIFSSLALFGVGAIVAAVAHNFTTVLVGRSIQGMGGGGIITCTEIVVTDMVPLRHRGKWFSFISAAWAVGTVGGPLLGGGFSQSSATWRWIFWINLPLIGIGTIMIILFLKLQYKTTTFMNKLREVDWIGVVLFISSLTGFLIPLTWGGVMYAWSSWRTLFPLILCGCGLIVFVVYEEWLERRGGNPMIRFSVTKQRTSAVTYIGTFLRKSNTFGFQTTFLTLL
jgi:MFS family permease